MVSERQDNRHDDNMFDAPGGYSFQPAVGIAPGDAQRTYQQTTTAEPSGIDDEEPTLRNQAGERKFPKSVTEIAALVAIGFGFYTADLVGTRRLEQHFTERAAEQAEANKEAELTEDLRRLKVVEKFLARKVEASYGEERIQAEQELAAWREKYPELTSLTAGL